MILKIKSVQSKPFKGSEGEMVPYFWTRAERADGVTIQFGGVVDYSGKVGEQLELNVEKQEFSNGKTGYREVH